MLFAKVTKLEYAFEVFIAIYWRIFATPPSLLQITRNATNSNRSITKALTIVFNWLQLELNFPFVRRLASLSRLLVFGTIKKPSMQEITRAIENHFLCFALSFLSKSSNILFYFQILGNHDSYKYETFHSTSIKNLSTAIKNKIMRKYIQHQSVPHSARNFSDKLITSYRWNLGWELMKPVYHTTIIKVLSISLLIEQQACHWDVSAKHLLKGRCANARMLSNKSETILGFNIRHDNEDMTNAWTLILHNFFLLAYTEIIQIQSANNNETP